MSSTFKITEIQINLDESRSIVLQLNESLTGSIQKLHDNAKCKFHIHFVNTLGPLFAFDYVV